METQLITARIHENGNGLPSVGELCYDSSSNTVYRVVDLCGNIETHSPGVGNSIIVELEEVGDPSDVTDEEWEEIESNNYSVIL